MMSFEKWVYSDLAKGVAPDSYSIAYEAYCFEQWLNSEFAVSLDPDFYSEAYDAYLENYIKKN